MVLQRVEAIVIGAGVIGLAVARALARRGHEVVVLEAENAVSQHTSSRNSEVIHAGLYYRPGSLKARLCRRGQARIYEFCARRNIAHRRIGKLIVATTDDECERLHALWDNARANDVDSLMWVGQERLRSLEPAVHGVAALWSPTTGIIDAHEFARALASEAEAAGATIVPRAPFHRATVDDNGFVVEAGDAQLFCSMVVNAAGLWASSVARRISGLSPESIPETRLCKGTYFRLRGANPFAHLIYPLPDAGGLGVHVTIDLAGGVRFGPDTQWLPKPAPDALELDYGVDVSRREVFAAAIARYAPSISAERLEPAFAGIRPKLHDPDQPAADFVISGPREHGVDRLVNLYGIESPGLTASLPLADEVLHALQLS